MGPRSKIISKFFRIKMAGELRRFVAALPVRGLVESHMGDNVYMANGEIRVGHTWYPVGVRIWLQQERVVAQVAAPEAAVSIFTDPFDPDKTAEVVRRATTKEAS